ncbi:MAG: hypothetical protein JSW00_09450 [Thermoplasmata archaeon]|nr:MAG: hypothetical protein JSW00_09450 [Thermoplasmata archaeon]
MVALKADTVSKIETAQNEVEPHIIDMIKHSDESNCPFKLLSISDSKSNETKDAVTSVARMLYKNKLLPKLNISLSNEESYDTLVYAFKYWGANTLSKHGNKICTCEKKCY